jgi:hypothetical protein
MIEDSSQLPSRSPVEPSSRRRRRLPRTGPIQVPVLLGQGEADALVLTIDSTHGGERR